LEQLIYGNVRQDQLYDFADGFFATKHGSGKGHSLNISSDS